MREEGGVRWKNVTLERKRELFFKGGTPFARGRHMVFEREKMKRMSRAGKERGEAVLPDLWKVENGKKLSGR